MAILGLTHQPDGSSVQKFHVAIKVSIGRLVETPDGNMEPRPLDHFVFERRALFGDKVLWLPAPEIAELFGERPTELDILLLNDTLDEVFRSKMGWLEDGGYRCQGKMVQIGDGKFEMQAIRRTTLHPEGEPWPGGREYTRGALKGQPIEGCGFQCPDYKRGDCGAHGDLYFRLVRYPVRGAICWLHTGSGTSVLNLSTGLEDISEAKRGRLGGVVAKLRVTPRTTCNLNGNGRQPYYVLGIESLSTKELRTKPGANGGSATTSGGSSSSHSSREQYAVIETDSERQRVAQEFCRSNGKSGHAEASAASQSSHQENSEHRPRGSVTGDAATAVSDQKRTIFELARTVGYSRGSIQMQLGRYAGNLELLREKLQAELNEIRRNDAHLSSQTRPATTVAEAD
jgi:hypothetical protein